MEYNTRENNKIEKKNNLIYKTIYLTQSSWIYKVIFRQYRAFKTIENKSVLSFNYIYKIIVTYFYKTRNIPPYKIYKTK